MTGEFLHCVDMALHVERHHGRLVPRLKIRSKIIFVNK
jgi:hypothetical protein